jgi:putative transposase
MYVDNGPEFRSASMRATEGPLNMTIVDLPRAAGWLKGRIESWFRTFNLRLVHGLPGTTKSNPAGRGNYKSEKHAYLTLDEVIWIVTKWIVDEYHSTEHGETGETPLLMYERGIEESGQPAAPPKDLIAPLTGTVVKRKLTRDGIAWKKLRWQSDDFSALLNRTTKLETGRGKRIKGQIMTVRLDPLDLKKIYVLDPTREGKRNAWIEGDLETDDPNIINMTLAQYEHYRKTKLTTRPPYDREKAVKRARASRDISEFLESKRPPRKVPAKLRHLRTDGRNASHHVRGSRFSTEESRLPVGSHDHHDPKLLSPPPDPRGPYRGRSPDPMPSDAREIPIQPLDTEAFNETKRDADRAAASVEPAKSNSRPKMVVKFLPKRK